MKRIILPAVLLATILGCAVMSEAAVTPVYHCPKVSKPPVIDGKLDDEAWKSAPPIRLVLSQTGEPATKKTIARMCWDDENLYISFDCEDEDIWNDYTKRDDPVYNQEVCEAFLAPTCDLDRYFEINVSPRNVVFDALIRYAVKGVPGEGTDHGWNCEGLRTAVVLDGTIDNRTDKDRGYTVEMAVPFAGLGRSTPKPVERWRANLYRIDLSPLPIEYQAWSPTLVNPAAFHVPERFGTIFFEQ
jgi:hypothetical protein